MAIVVKDGSGLAEANSYASEDTLGTYADDRAVTLANGDAEAALIRATAWIDATYRSRWPGARVNGRAQGLAWPRSDAVDADGEEITDDEIPEEVVRATCEAAIRELTEPGSLLPDLERGGAIRRLKAGSVEVEYATTAAVGTTFTAIDGILSGALVGGASVALTARAVRA